MQHLCKSKLPKWFIWTFANTTMSLSNAGWSLEELTCRAPSFGDEVGPVEPHLDFKDLPFWDAVPQEVVQPLRRCEVQSCEKNTFWKGDLERHVYDRSWIYAGFGLLFVLIWKVYFWKASRPSQPVINKVFTQLKIMTNTDKLPSSAFALSSSQTQARSVIQSGHRLPASFLPSLSAVVLTLPHITSAFHIQKKTCPLFKKKTTKKPPKQPKPEKNSNQKTSQQPETPTQQHWHV